MSDSFTYATSPMMNNLSKQLLVTMNAKGQMSFTPVDRKGAELQQYMQENKLHLSRKFELNDEQFAKYKKWLIEQDTKVAQKQNRTLPYYGASGGAYTFSFTPHGLGVMIKVTNCMTGESIDLSEYDL